MRIISGSLKRRKLLTLKGKDIRPTSDRVRESIFNIIGQQVNEARVLDLFAGTGALGIEALSRGAASATFIDNSKQACSLIEDHISLFDLSFAATVFCHPIDINLVPEPVRRLQFDLIFMDPPYNTGLFETVLTSEILETLLSETGLIVAENPVKEQVPQLAKGLKIIDRRKYGKTRITLITKQE